MTKVVFILFISVSAVAQQRDNVWLLGAIPDQYIHNGLLDFSFGFPIGDTLLNSVMPIVAHTNICDTLGELLFYTNGIWIANRNDDTMLNGYGVTSGWGANFYNSSGVLILQGTLILPIPDHPSEYYLFAVNADDSISFRPRKLVYSRIDMSLDNGLGGVTDKNISIIDDTLTNGRITACKHADGKSWWLISHETGSSKYYKWLITADTIAGPYAQIIGSNYGTWFIDVGGQSCFSQNGQKFATFGNNNKVDIMDFDRCTGMFSNCKTISFTTADTDFIAIGCAFSPNGRFIYINTQMRLWQIDLEADTLENSIDTIGYFDGFYDPFWTLFGPSQLAPDGKIYFGEWNGNLSMHVINAPNEKGTACDFQQHSYHLPVYNCTLPNFVNYDLGSTRIYQADAGSDKYIYGIDTVQIGIAPLDSLIYQWSPTSSLSNPNIAQPSAFPITTTKYYLTIIDTTDTTDCNQRTDSVIVHVNEYPAGSSIFSQTIFQVFPNPARGQLFVNLPENSSLQELKIVNAIGETIMTNKFLGRRISLNISTLPTGIYFLEVQTEKEKLIKKFVKE